MTNTKRTYNTGKVVNHDELKELIKTAQANGDWSKVEQANVSKVKDMAYLFDGVKGIKDLNLDGWDTSNVVDMGFMFYKSDYNHLLSFDTSCVIDMCYMFYKSDYNRPLNFNTSNVTDMHCMFESSVYNHPLHFDTSNVEDVRHMFCNSKYNHPLDFDTSNVKHMNKIFDNAPITSPITFTGGNIPYDVQEFINENNIAYEEKCKLEGAVYHKGDNKSVIVSSFKL